MFGRKISVVAFKLTSLADERLRIPITPALMTNIANASKGKTLPYSQEDMNNVFDFTHFCDPLHPSMAIEDVEVAHTGMHDFGFGGKFTMYAFRRDTHTVPAGEVNAEIERMLYEQYEGRAIRRPILTKGEKADLKIQAILRIAHQFPVKSKVVYAFLEHNTGILFVVCKSMGVVEKILNLLKNLHAQIDNNQTTSFTIVSPWEEAAYRAGIDFTDLNRGYPGELTAQYLTWLWFLESTGKFRSSAGGIPLKEIRGAEWETMRTQLSPKGKVVAYSDAGFEENIWTSTEHELDRLRYIMYKEDAYIGDARIFFTFGEDSIVGEAGVSSAHKWGVDLEVYSGSAGEMTLGKYPVAHALAKAVESVEADGLLTISGYFSVYTALLSTMSAFLRLTRAITTGPRNWDSTHRDIREWLEGYVPECEIDKKTAAPE